MFADHNEQPAAEKKNLSKIVWKNNRFGRIFSWSYTKARTHTAHAEHQHTRHTHTYSIVIREIKPVSIFFCFVIPPF